MIDIYFTLDNLSPSRDSDFSGKSYGQVLISYWSRCLYWVFYRVGLGNGLCLKMACLSGEGTRVCQDGAGTFRPFEL